MLGPGNESAAEEAVSAWPGGLQVGGGITADNAPLWIEKGAAAVIVTSYVFKNGVIHEGRLKEIVAAVGKDNLVLDLSCRKKGSAYYIVTDRWQKFTNVTVTRESLDFFAEFCAEFLIHAVDVEGKCAGIDTDLAEKLGEWTGIPTTYAGGVRSLKDLELLNDIGRGRLDATIGSALDIFGGTGITYQDAVDFHNLHKNDS